MPYADGKGKPEHMPVGDPCLLCGISANRHRQRIRGPRTEYKRDYREQNRQHLRDYHNQYKRDHPIEKRYIGIDGEGWTDKSTGKHHYSYLAACDTNGLIGDIYRHEGLRSVEIFEFLLSLPQGSWNLKVGFSLGYDITKWLEDLPHSAIYLLNHPELRKGKNGPRDVKWAGFNFNRLSSQFKVIRYSNDGIRRAVIWDLFRFFGKAFVPALQDWKVGDKDTWDHIQAMKDKRGDFQGINEDEKKYCQAECVLMAQLAKTLIDAHLAADIKLTSYYGPGSTASAMLKTMKAKEETATIPKDMEYAVECAFFGGRFECAWAGPLENVEGYDIASAYPFAMTQLPCFKHGKWELVKNPKDSDIEKAIAACVHYYLPEWGGLRIIKEIDKDILKSKVKADGRVADHAWGPFPFRLADGNILFPVTCEGGWVWKHEYLTGLRFFSNVAAKEAWILKNNCSCGKPFGQQVSTYYNKRLEWGKEGKGIALKLGINSCYGKRAQRVGSAPYRCVVSAGNITSMTRAMLLGAIFKANEPWNVIGLATDGIQAQCKLDLPKPPITGTEETAVKRGKFPLGAWESKGADHIHNIRPGMRFSLTRDAKRETTAARGIGVRVLHSNRDLVRAYWDIDPGGDCLIQQPMIFMGSKSCIRPTTEAKAILELVKIGKTTLREQAAALAGAFDRDEKYGNWVEPEERKVSYNPLPKRPAWERIEDKGNVRFRLFTWALSRAQGESVPYGKSHLSLLVKEIKAQKLLEEEQADQEGLHTLDHLEH